MFVAQTANRRFLLVLSSIALSILMIAAQAFPEVIPLPIIRMRMLLLQAIAR